MTNKNLLVIGAGPGISQSTVKKFSAEGFHVFLAARNTEKLSDTIREINQTGGHAESYQVDACDANAVKRLIETIENQSGPIEVLLYNAASKRNESIFVQPLDSFNTDLAINVGGAQAAIQALTPKMFERKSGTILLTGGGFAMSPQPEFISLSVGKAAIRALSQGVFESFKEKGVHIATVTISTFVDPDSDEARGISERFWELYQQPLKQWEWESHYPN